MRKKKIHLVVVDHDDRLRLLQGALLLGGDHPPMPIPVQDKAEWKDSGADNGK